MAGAQARQLGFCHELGRRNCRLPQAQPAIIGRYALIGVDLKPIGGEQIGELFEQEPVLEYAATQRNQP